MKKFCIFAFLSLLVFAVSCSEDEKKSSFNVGIFIPGVISGSPVYESMVNGASDLINDYTNINVNVFEAGYNQANWETLLTSFVSEGSYDIVLTTNPALPEIIERVSKSFENQKFIVTDAYYTNNKNIKTIMFDQYEQSFVLGYAAALISKSKLPNIDTNSKKIGFIISQEYPIINKHVLPGFLNGAKYAYNDFEIDYRVIGNWYDSVKALELTKSMLMNNINVIGIIAGNASIGAITAVKESGKYIVYHNTDEYAKAEGNILLCGFIDQYNLTKDIIIKAHDKTLNYSNARIVGIKEGYIEILNESEYYKKYMPDDIKIKIDKLLKEIENGEIVFDVIPL